VIVLYVCVSVCEQDYLKSIELISLTLGVMIGPTSWKNWLTFGGLRTQIQIPDHFSIFLTIVEYGILGDLLAFLIQSLPSFLQNLAK